METHTMHRKVARPGCTHVMLELNRLVSLKTAAPKGYPSYYGNKNKPPVQLSTHPEQIPNPNVPGTSTAGWLHHPLIPNQQETSHGHKRDAGKVRSVYPPSNPADFDVIYHTGQRG